MRISDWSSDVCSSDLGRVPAPLLGWPSPAFPVTPKKLAAPAAPAGCRMPRCPDTWRLNAPRRDRCDASPAGWQFPPFAPKSGARYALLFGRSEEHTSELQSLMRISYAVFCLKKKKKETK